ncbi:hypothetical protein Dimus_027993 [Dionaea muscipula]
MIFGDFHSAFVVFGTTSISFGLQQSDWAQPDKSNVCGHVGLVRDLDFGVSDLTFPDLKSGVGGRIGLVRDLNFAVSDLAFLDFARSVCSFVVIFVGVFGFVVGVFTVSGLDKRNVVKVEIIIFGDFHSMFVVYETTFVSFGLRQLD